jgi:hypothetical protein
MDDNQLNQVQSRKDELNYKIVLIPKDLLSGLDDSSHMFLQKSTSTMPRSRLKSAYEKSEQL